MKRRGNSLHVTRISTEKKQLRGSKSVVLRVSETVATQDLLINAWACAFPEEGIVYLSGPITTGTRFLSWYASSGKLLEPQSKEYSDELREHVISPNERDIHQRAKELRKRLTKPVLEPASLRIDGWTQVDYHILGNTIEFSP